MQRITLFLIFLTTLITTKAHAQQLILTQQQNDAWYAAFYKAPLNQQVQLLKIRLLADTNVYIENIKNDKKLPKTEIEKRMAIGISKPFVSVVFAKGVMYAQGPYIKNNNKVKAFCNALTIDNVEVIEISRAKNQATTSVANSIHGMIVVHAKNKAFADAVMAIEKSAR
jgi:hypothetical protein